MSRLPLFLLPAALVLLSACRGHKTDAPAAPADTPVVETTCDTLTDSIATDEPEPPAAADGVFDDFIFNFMRNRSFQRQRVSFPLPVRDGGTERSLQASEWRHDRIFSKDDVYALLFDSPKAMSKKAYAGQDSAVISVLNLTAESVKHYVFHKERGAWMLTSVSTKAVRDEEGGDFMSFLLRFSASGEFRRSHVAQSFDLVVLDPDTFEPMQGTAEASQWDDYAPELPTDKLALVTHGGVKAGGTERILQVTSLEGAMSSLITFRRQGGRWTAVKLENN
ncbi:MAG: DUF4348 domain-containing protein [Alloprevotella sp.]|nr:DUF4348 domain-containing protein [Alloprevotella sp.]